jgi:hypothetical protein
VKAIVAYTAREGRVALALWPMRGVWLTRQICMQRLCHSDQPQTQTDGTVLCKGPIKLYVFGLKRVVSGDHLANSITLGILPGVPCL